MKPVMEQVPCKKLYRASDKRVEPVQLAVLHWTASPPKAPEAADPERMRRWLADTNRQQSTHFIILRDGSIMQAASLQERTWHAGGAFWPCPPTVGKPGGVNLRSIGIDLENVGYLSKKPQGSGFIDGYGGTYRGATPVKVGPQFFEPYTAPQLTSLETLALWLLEEMPVLRDQSKCTRWVGHSKIQPGKSDPGPLFPWKRLEELIDIQP